MQYTLLTTQPGTMVQGQVVQTVSGKANNDLFGKHDPNGFGMTLIAMGVVLGALAILALIFQLIGLIYRGKPTSLKVYKTTGREPLPKKPNANAAMRAAVFLALHQYANEARDEEAAIIAIDGQLRRNTPWATRTFHRMDGRSR